MKQQQTNGNYSCLLEGSCSKDNFGPSRLALLENHHSSPFYVSIRRMTWWNNQNGQYWKGAWNVGKGQGKNPGKAKTQGKKKKEPPSKEADQKFPSYDTMWVGESGSSSSTAGSSTQESQLKRIMKEMVQSNSVKLLDEAMKLLEEEDGEDFRTEMKRTQVALNKRRKAHARLQRLKEALSTKHEQFRAFKQTLRGNNCRLSRRSTMWMWRVSRRAFRKQRKP